jgi:hypothetical protein
MWQISFWEGLSLFRELMPQDLKLEIDQLARDEAVSAARYLAAVVGKARSCATDDARRAWMLLDGYGAAWSNSSQITRPHISNIVRGMQLHREKPHNEGLVLNRRGFPPCLRFTAGRLLIDG